MMAFLMDEMPAKIQTEDYITMAGIDTENITDTGGGKDVGWFIEPEKSTIS